MDDLEFPFPVAVLTIAVAGPVLMWQRVRDQASARDAAPAEPFCTCALRSPCPACA